MRFRSAVLFTVASCVAGFLGTCMLEGCATLQAEKAAAEASYFGQQLKCVDDGTTREEVARCRDKVKAEWANADAQASKAGGSR